MDKESKRYSDMYKYTRSGTTLYDLLAEYMGETDYSPKAVFNSYRRDVNLQQPKFSGLTQKQFIGFVSTYNGSIHGKIVDSMLERTNADEKYELLKKFQAVAPDKYKFQNITAYLGFLQEVNFTPRAVVHDPEQDVPPSLDPEIEELNRILIDEAVAKADPALVKRIRNVIVHMVYMPFVKRQILKENPERDLEKNPKLKKLDFFNKMFTNQDAIEEYDFAVNYTKQKEEALLEKLQLETGCKLSRLSSLSNYTGKTVQELLEVSEDPEKSLIELISVPEEGLKPIYNLKQGDYEWGIRLYPEPVLVCNEPVEYTENGIENQKLIVASYGDFSFQRSLGNSRYSEMPMQLIGVTILGEDGNKNYFVVTPAANIANLRNSSNREYYKKVLFSDFVLDDTIISREKLLPELEVDENGNAKLYDDNVGLINMKRAEAVRYANRYEGSMGRGKPHATLQDLCHSPELFRKQMELVYDLQYKGKHERQDKEDDDLGEFE